MCHKRLVVNYVAWNKLFDQACNKRAQIVYGGTVECLFTKITPLTIVYGCLLVVYIRMTVVTVITW